MEISLILKSKEKFGLNWFPFQKKPNFVSFSYLLIRMTVFSWGILFFVTAPIYYYTENLEFIKNFSVIVISIFVIFEEQSRWLYINRSSNIIQDSSIFFIFVVLLETLGFFLLSDDTFQIYVSARAPSILLHALNSVICICSFRSQTKIYYFFVAVIFHIGFNLMI